MMKMKFLVLLVFVSLYGAWASMEGEEDESEVFAIIRKFDQSDETREKRAVGLGSPAQLPSTNFTSEDFHNQYPNAPFIMGQCVMCPPGGPGPRGPPGGVGSLRTPVRNQQLPEAPTPTAGGVVYTRWGKTTCPETAELIYHGVVAGSHSQGHRGSGSNYLCLPHNPTFADDPDFNGGALMYGVEFNNDLFTSPGILQSEASCAVCLSRTKSTYVVMPGTNVCLGDQDWTLEYHGYMMSSHHSHHKTEFICVDHIAEGIPRTNHNNDESTLYVADAHCSASGGGLPCPPYNTNWDILCAVCTI